MPSPRLSVRSPRHYTPPRPIGHSIYIHLLLLRRPSMDDLAENRASSLACAALKSRAVFLWSCLWSAIIGRQCLVLTRDSHATACHRVVRCQFLGRVHRSVQSSFCFVGFEACPNCLWRQPVPARCRSLVAVLCLQWDW